MSYLASRVKFGVKAARLVEAVSISGRKWWTLEYTNDGESWAVIGRSDDKAVIELMHAELVMGVHPYYYIKE